MTQQRACVIEAGWLGFRGSSSGDGEEIGIFEHQFPPNTGWSWDEGGFNSDFDESICIWLMYR